MKKLLILLIILIVVTILLIFIFSRKQEPSSFNFILHFDEAQKVNFEKGSELDDRLPTRNFIFDRHLFNRQAYLLFSQNVEILAKNSEVKNDIKEDIKSGGFRLIFPSKASGGETTLVFKKKDELNYWSSRINFVNNECEIKIYRVKNGHQEQLDRFNFKYAINKTYIVMVVFFRDFLIISNENKILFQMKSPELMETGKVSFKVPSKTAKGFVLKFAKMNKEIESYLLNWYSKTFSSAPDHKFNCLQKPWNQIYFRPLLVIDGKTNPFLRRLRIGNDTRPAIFMKMNSEISYKLKVPDKSTLEFCLSVVPVYITSLDRLKFTVEFVRLRSGEIKKFDINLSHHWRISQKFIPYKMDISEFGGEKCKITFRFNTTDGKQINDEGKIILSLASPVIYPERPSKDRNVILISLDTLRASSLRCYGYARDTSSNIDSFASKGTLFANATACSDWTLSSHLSLFTSMYPFETGLLKIADFSDTRDKEISSFRGSFISDDLPTIAQYLQKTGYKTIGIHGGGFVSDFYGFDKGFDTYNKKNVSVSEAVNTAIQVLDKNKSQKFFMFFHTYEIHEPYKHDYFLSQLSSPENSFLNKIIAKYDSGIRFTDSEIGRLIDWLKKSGLFENTLIIITSDHGENFDYIREKPGAGTHGITLYDVETHIPLIFGGAAEFNTSQVIEDQVSQVDVLPTILDFLDIPLEREVRGISLMPLLDRKNDVKRMAYSEATYMIMEKKSIRSLNYKLIATIARKETDGSLKINYELFNLRKNIKEKEDVFHLEPSVAKDYMKYLNNILKSIEENRAKLAKTSSATPAQDKELLEDLKGLGYIGN